MKKNIWLS